MDHKPDLKTTFNKEARLYDSIRPVYPEELFDQAVKIAGLTLISKLLEIGPGTGQATLPFAERGFDIKAVELGTELAQVAGRNLKNYKNVEVINSSFEDADFPDASFDLIYAATSFHWVKPEVRFVKSAKLLKNNGYLAIISTNHVSDERGDKFFYSSQPIYKKYKPGGSFDEKFRLPKKSDLRAYPDDSILFDQVYFGVFPVTKRYTAKEYVDLVNTYSPVLAMNPKSRKSFLMALKSLIEDDFGGYKTEHFAFTLTIFKKK